MTAMIVATFAFAPPCVHVSLLFTPAAVLHAPAVRPWCMERADEDSPVAAAQPVPFPYFHVINFMLSVNLVLVAYSLTFIDSIMTVPLFFIVCLVLH